MRHAMHNGVNTTAELQRDAVNWANYPLSLSHILPPTASLSDFLTLISITGQTPTHIFHLLSLIQTQTQTLSLYHTHTYTHTNTLYHPHPLSLSHTYTHTHTPSQASTDVS